MNTRLTLTLKKRDLGRKFCREGVSGNSILPGGGKGKETLKDPIKKTG